MLLSITEWSRSQTMVVSPSETGTLNLAYIGLPLPTSTTVVILAASSNVTIGKTVDTDGNVTFTDSDFVSNSLHSGIYEVILTFPCCGGNSVNTAIVYELPVTVPDLVV